VYLEHLSRIVQPLLDDGLAVTFWGDVLERHPEELAQLPDGDLTPVIWTYESPQSSVPDAPPFLREVLAKLGIDLDQPPGFASHAEHVIAAGRPFWVAPGTSTWNTLVGRLDNALENLLDAATVARDVGCGGVLVTDWGDNGHHQPPSVSYPGIVYGGAVAWCVDTNRDLDVAATIDRCVVGDSAGKIGHVLTTIGRAGARTGVPTMNSSPLFNALLPHLPTASFGTAEPDAMAAVIASLDGAVDDLAHARPSAVDGTRVVDELTVATRLARLGALRMVERGGGRTASAAEQRAELAELVGRYRASWLSSSRRGGLDTSAGHLERTLRAYDEA
jgi:hexosaminidase